MSASKAYKFKIMQTYSSADEIEIAEIVVPSLQQLTLLFNGERGHCNRGREVSTTEKATCLHTVNFCIRVSLPYLKFSLA